jgi:simple sugar transport system permease protein
MDALLTQTFLTALLFGAVTAGVPLLLAGLGEQISEKSGVLNIGIEGMMLFGAYTGFVAAYYSNSFALGFLAGGLGGAYMANVGAGLFVPFMTGGAGFIGIVLAMLARGRPIWVLLGAALFGCSLSMTTALQVAGVDIPTDVVQMLPFAMVMLVLVVFARHSVLPPALGLPYVRGDR